MGEVRSCFGEFLQRLDSVCEQSFSGDFQEFQCRSLRDEQAVFAHVASLAQVRFVFGLHELAKVVPDFRNEAPPYGGEAALQRRCPDLWPCEQGVLLPGLGQVSEREDAPEVFVAVLDAASANETAHRLFSDGGMVQQVGECHGFGPGDGDAEWCVDALKLRE